MAIKSREDSSVHSIYSLDIKGSRSCEQKCTRQLHVGETRSGGSVGSLDSLIGHELSALIRDGLPAFRNGVCFPCLVEDALNFFGVGGGVCSACRWRDLELGDESGGVDIKVVGEGGEDEDGADEEEGEEGEEDGALASHGGRDEGALLGLASYGGLGWGKSSESATVWVTRARPSRP